eukprot:SAG11_NODE_11921_length_731_cov_1.219937_1_plen_88_part_00
MNNAVIEPLLHGASAMMVSNAGHQRGRMRARVRTALLQVHCWCSTPTALLESVTQSLYRQSNSGELSGDTVRELQPVRGGVGCPHRR